jgi:hypothetical protein
MLLWVGFYATERVFTILDFLRNWPNKFEYLSHKPFQLSVMEQSSLLGRFVSYEENSVVNTAPSTLL